MSDCGCEVEIKDKAQSKDLIILLAINGLMFLLEIVLGIISESSALIADSLDMLADATVYGIGLYAVGRAASAKVKAARVAAITEIALGLLVLSDVLRRFFLGHDPQSMFMIVVGLLALLANIACLWLIAKHRDGEVHMRASWIFSKNDVIANVGTIIAGVLVYALASPYPDLIIGLAISLIVIRGGIQIIKLETR